MLSLLLNIADIVIIQVSKNGKIRDFIIYVETGKQTQNKDK